MGYMAHLTHVKRASFSYKVNFMTQSNRAMTRPIKPIKRQKCLFCQKRDDQILLPVGPEVEYVALHRFLLNPLLDTITIPIMTPLIAKGYKWID